MNARAYQLILQVSLFLSLGVVFLLFPGFLFPYISSKQFTFNILMELLFPIFLILVWKFPSYRPPRSLLSLGLLLFLLFILISAFTGVDFNLSFWGNIERSLGFFHIFHFFLFYLYLITAFREAKDWYWFLSASVFVATVQSVLVLFVDRIATIGNTAYISAYLIFNFYFALILIARSHWTKRWPFYIALIFILLAFIKANTSGAIIALFISLLFLLILLGLLAHKQKIRRISLVVFICLFLSSVFVFSQYNQTWFKENRVLRNLSVHKDTFQTRKLSWEGAMKDFSKHPWLGTGFGNYAIIFDRQFNPEFLNYSPHETYFDRAHNNIIDILSTMGILGLLAYLSIFVFALRDYLSGLRAENWRLLPGKEGLRARELILLSALFVAYFVQNLAVFDSLVTYMGLMMALAYLVFLTRAKTLELNIEEASNFSLKKEILILASSFILILIILFNFNIRPLKMSTQVIEAYSHVLSGQVPEGFSLAQKALSHDTPLDRDGRKVFISLIIRRPTLLTHLPASEVESSLEYLLNLSEKNLSYNPQDSLMQTQMAQLYDIASRYHHQDPDRFRHYSDLALLSAEKALAASPKRVPVYFVLAQIQANRGDLEGAENSFLEAYRLNPAHIETHCQLANYYFLIQDNRYQNYTDYCLSGESKNLVPGLLSSLAQIYEEEESLAELLIVYRTMVDKGVLDPMLYINLAKIELEMGNVLEAIQAAVLASELDENLRPITQEFLADLQEIVY